MSHAANMGLPGTVEFMGKVRQFSRQDNFAVRARFYDWVKQTARAELRADKKNMTESEYDQAQDRLNEKISTRQYTYGTKWYNSAVTTDDGMSQLWWIMLNEQDKTLTYEAFREEYDRLDKTPGAFAKLISTFAERDEEDDRPRPPVPPQTSGQV